MKKYLSLLLIAGFFFSTQAQAQYRRAPRIRRYPQTRSRQQPVNFKPYATLSVGYGYPNLDKDQLYQFYNAYQGPVSSSGVVQGALTYQYSPSSGIGVLVTHARLTAPYYNYGAAAGSKPAINATLESYSVLLNLVRYLPGSKVVSPYLRTAVGINLWNQHYTDGSGNAVPLTNPGSLAYQASLGVKLALSAHTGLFAEAGYGKYIVSGGLAVRF